MFYLPKKPKSLKVKEIIDLTNSKSNSLTAEQMEKEIFNPRSINTANQDEITFYSNPKYAKYLKSTNAGVCLIKPEFANKLNRNTIPILNSNPYIAFAKLMEIFFGLSEVESYKKNELLSPKANISKTAKIGQNVRIMENVYIGENVEIEENVVIMPNAFIGNEVKIGKNVVIHDNTSLMFCKIGEGSIIRSGARIGSSGFGFAPNFEDGKHFYIPQVSGVIIGKYVDIGSNTVIDRGCLEETVIDDYSKIDNLVQIGHGAKIGKSCIIAGQAGLAGSATIGNFVFMGPQSGISGHITIADFTQVVGQSGVAKDVIDKGTILAGSPAILKSQWEKTHFKLAKLLFNK